MRVIFVVIDALPNRWVGEKWTPNLWKVLGDGGWNPSGGRAVLSTATYPNHASFATGRDPSSHGIFVNRVWDGSQFIISSKVGPKGDTIFKAAKRSQVSSAVVVGDHKLIGVMGADQADVCWPPDGERQDVDLDEFRYAADTSVLNAVDAIHLMEADLGFVHFNEPDTVCHMYGPDAVETKERIQQTDAAFGALVERCKSRWDETIMIVVSDHDQEQVVDYGFDLADVFSQKGLPGVVENEGTCAVVLDGPDITTLKSIDHIEGASILDDRHSLVWGKPGHIFGPWLEDLHGSHGSPRTSTQVAVVGGGHPKVKQLASLISKERPVAVDWAHHINGLLDLDLEV
tara:strand:+ start:46 stop:1077 length:1032 start_codon:yes stop_codon:yes gene_type:complete